MQVLSVASEAFPLIKTGGLADVVGALPHALAGEGVAMRTLLPGYPPVMAGLTGAETVAEFAGLFGGPARLLAGRAGGLDLFALDAPHLYARHGNPYTAPNGQDWPDNAQRFAALARVGADIAQGAVAAWQPDVVQTHDWQTALLPAYLHYDGGERRVGTVMTVHNLAFQGQFPASLLAELRLPPGAYALEGVEYYSSIGFLKAGLFFADRITTVSPTYAAEICSPEGGMGMQGLLRSRAGVVAGILNGIDEDIWDPAKDKLLPAGFDAARLDRRAENRTVLQRRMALEETAAPLFAVISRLTWQKGMDMLLAALPALLAEGAQLAVLGAGDAAIEAGVRDAVARFPGRVGCVIGYDEALAHLMQGGADALLVPSRFEPCGLTQLCALRYGSVPVVARTGGLADTIIDASPMALAAKVASGIQFAPVTTEMLEIAIRRAVRLHRDRAAWRRIQENGMAADVSWRDPARRYAELYLEIVR